MTKEKSQTIEHKFDKMSHSNQLICDFDASEFPRMRSQKMLRNYNNFMETYDAPDEGAQMVTNEIDDFEQRLIHGANYSTGITFHNSKKKNTTKSFISPGKGKKIN